jgi:hypothetical protein
MILNELIQRIQTSVIDILSTPGTAAFLLSTAILSRFVLGFRFAFELRNLPKSNSNDNDDENSNKVGKKLRILTHNVWYILKFLFLFSYYKQYINKLFNPPFKKIGHII